MTPTSSARSASGIISAPHLQGRLPRTTSGAETANFALHVQG